MFLVFFFVFFFCRVHFMCLRLKSWILKSWIVFSWPFIGAKQQSVCLIRINEQVGEKRGTVCTHRYADCLLKNTSTKDNKYVVNQKLEHVDDISFRELFSRISVFLQNKICPFLAQGICIYVGHSSLWNTAGPTPLICPSA